MQKDSWALVILILMPIAGSLVALMFPKRNIGAVAALLSFMTIGYVAVMVLQFKTFQGLQQNMDKEWIPQLGITFSLGVDGLNVFLIALTAVAWSVATFAASRREIEQPRMFYMMMALAQAGTIGAFAAQDLILFVLFFDLLLIPFYFLIGMWGEGDRAAATTKFVIYTLVGSLLMFAAAIGLGVSMAAHGNNELSFAFTDLAQGSIPDAAQKWIFAGFAIALLIKMPLPPLHGWMPDTYRSAPLAVLIPLSAVVAKLGAYGFLRVVLPLLPDASADFSDLMIVLSIIGIVYGSVMAFTQDNARLVIGYSSIAQIGFIGLGIFALDPKGAEGAVLQMVNHGLVVIPLFLIVGMLRERAGSESLSQLGGMAKNAPAFAALFLIVTLATLAMPGSPNFVGELYILFGAFDSNFTYGAIASIGVVLAAVYMIRFFQRTMHNPLPEGAESRELTQVELGLLLPAIAITLALAVYPQFMVDKIRPAAAYSVSAIKDDSAPKPKAALGSEPPVEANR